MPFSLKKAIEIEILGKDTSFYILKLLKILMLGGGGACIILWYRLACYFKKRWERLARHILKGIALKYSVYIGYNTEIDYGLKMPHPTGIVIGEYVKIGKNCIIFQQVTIGGSRIGDVQEKKQPRIGNNNVLFSGAKILGGITISDNVIVGANAVVLKDIPSNSVAVGIPAKITKNDRTEI